MSLEVERVKAEQNIHIDFLEYLMLYQVFFESERKGTQGISGIDALLSNAMRSADLTDILCLALEISLEQPQNQSIVQQVQGQSLEFDESLS
jgi:hypothetical protein